MTVVIAHRGRIENSIHEDNTLEALEECLGLGFGCEIDVHEYNGSFYLGHDNGNKKIDLKNIDIQGVIVHLKTPVQVDFSFADSFYLDKDNCAYTQKGLIWVNVGIDFSGSKKIICSPELTGGEFSSLNIEHIADAYGICTDYPCNAKEMLGANWNNAC